MSGKFTGHGMNQDMKAKNRLSINVLNVKEKSKRLLSDSSHHSAGGETPWDFGPGIKTLKLSMVLLVFLYSTDDGKISVLEKRSFNKTIRSIDGFSERDKKELTSLLDVLPNANYVFGYIRSNELSSAVVMAAIKFLKEDIGLNKQDVKLLNDFTSQYKGLNQ